MIESDSTSGNSVARVQVRTTGFLEDQIISWLLKISSVLKSRNGRIIQQESFEHNQYGDTTRSILTRNMPDHSRVTLRTEFDPVPPGVEKPALLPPRYFVPAYDKKGKPILPMTELRELSLMPPQEHISGLLVSIKGVRVSDGALVQINMTGTKVKVDIEVTGVPFPVITS